MTLYKAIGMICPSEAPNKILFVAVDESVYENKVVFAFRSQFEQEAFAVVLGFPVILEHNLGP